MTFMTVGDYVTDLHRHQDQAHEACPVCAHVLEDATRVSGPCPDCGTCRSCWGLRLAVTGLAFANPNGEPAEGSLVLSACLCDPEGGDQK